MSHQILCFLVVEREVEPFKRAFGGTAQPLAIPLLRREYLYTLCKCVSFKVRKLVVHICGRARKHWVGAHELGDATWHRLDFL